jgi:hypothetical protein
MLRPDMSSWIWGEAGSVQQSDLCSRGFIFWRSGRRQLSFYCTVATESGHTTILWLRKVVTRLYCGYGKWSHDYTVVMESGHTTMLWLRKVFTRLYCGYGKWSHGWSGDGVRLLPLHAHYCIPRLPTLTYNQNKALAANKVRHGVIKQHNVKFKQLEGDLAIREGCDGDRSGDCFL